MTVSVDCKKYHVIVLSFQDTAHNNFKLHLTKVKLSIMGVTVNLSCSFYDTAPKTM